MCCWLTGCRRVRGTAEGGKGEHPGPAAEGGYPPLCPGRPPLQTEAATVGVMAGPRGRQGPPRGVQTTVSPTSAFCPPCLSTCPSAGRAWGAEGRGPAVTSTQVSLGARAVGWGAGRDSSASLLHLSVSPAVAALRSCAPARVDTVRTRMGLGAQADLIKPSTSFPSPCLLQNVPNRGAGLSLLMPSPFQDGAPGNTRIFPAWN